MYNWIIIEYIQRGEKASLVDDVVGCEFLQIGIKILGFDEEIVIKDGGELVFEHVHFVEADPAHLGVVDILVELVIVVFGGQDYRSQQEPKLLFNN